ncbi:hypothetical protein L249_3007 [Ophiocordyceps polyrhachis-furcata BCC 54312]|uniref:BRCT domain-containing protein n=1 Tax=Ophiocordyceps polyrhachis-furcata BCC 54312 TaxID=1330021 RepID=A0A367LN74_9HYPO|nr:hypothetical protein L249_3007 [Ophiocordyceps polyrhachis-furcata BCC 54312]
MPRHIFQNRVIAVAGPLPGQLTVDNLRRWTEARRGRFSDEVDSSVTHLLCTTEQFEQRVPRVKEGLALGKRCNVVHHDWFEFSIVSLQEKRLPEYPFRMLSRLAKQRAEERALNRLRRGEREGERSLILAGLFHVYRDRELFAYSIDLIRGGGGDEDEQRYTLCLWESNAKPHLYWFTAKFLKRRGDSRPSYHRPSRCSGKWRHEMLLFADFFRLKTGIEWQDRVLREKTMSGSYFHYAPPVGGKPVGRRLRFGYDYCREVNAQIRGLPYPQPSAVGDQHHHRRELDEDEALTGTHHHQPDRTDIE